MKAYIRETLHVLDYADNVVDTIFNSDDRITPGYAYNITITEANTGYSDLKFEMPNTILKDNADSIKNPKLALLTPLVKLRYHREVYYTGDQPITVREPSGYGDKVTYVDKTYSNVYPDNKIEDYVMDYIVQPVDKKRDVLKISTTFNAIDYPRFNLSKKRVGLTMVEQTLTHPEWSLYTNKPMDEPGKVKYIQWNSDLSQSAERSDIPLVWDPENAREYPLQKEDIIHLMANSADWPYGLLATCFYWPITSTGRFKGTLYKKGGYLILQIIDFYNLTTEGIDPSLYIDRYSWDWTQMYEIQPYLCPNNALNYLNHILEGTNWSVAMKADGVTPDVDVVQVEVPNPRGSTTSTTTADDTFSMNMSNGNCYNAITNVCKGLQLYPIFDCINRTVALKVFAGKNYGLTYALGNNLKDDSVKLDGEKVISKLYVTGGKDYNGDADINIGTAERSYIQKLNGIYNDAADLPTEDVAGYWAIVDAQIPDSAFEQIRYDKNMNPSTVEVHDTSVTGYWNASDGRQVYFYDNTTNTWSLGTKLDSGNWSGTVNGVEYIVDPISGSTAPWDPNDDMYIKMRSPYETNYILNVEWYYKNKWMTKEQILELYQYEQQINDLNESFVDGYVDDYRNTRQLYNDAVNNYDIAQDGYESTLLAMENKYYNVDGKYSEGTTYCFHRAPLGTYSAYNPDKQKTTKFIKLFHCYACGLTRGVENGSLIDPTGHEDNYSLGSLCPNCDSDDFVVNEIYVPVYDDFTFDYKESDYPHRPYETHRYNPHLKGYFERLVTTLDRQNRDVEWDVSAYEQRVSMIKGIPMDDQTVTLSDGYTYKLDGVYVRSASGQIEVWNDAIVNYIKNYGDMLTYLRQVNAMLARIQQLDDIYDEWKTMVDGINATIQEKFGDYIVEGNYKNEEQPYVELLFREGVEASDKYGVPPVTYNLNVIDSSGLIEYREPRVTKYRCGKCDYLSYHEIDSCPRCGESLILTEVDTYNDLVNILHSIGQIVPKAGDYIKIYDEPMGLFGVPGLITEITRYPDDPIKNQIKIDTGYTDDEELVGNIITATNTVLNNSDIYARTAILKGDGTIDEDSIRETLDDVHANISIVSTNGGILLDGTGLRAIDPTDPHRAMKYAGNGIFNTTNLDNEAGEAVIWEKMMSPSGINATYINSGSIDTNKLTIMSGLSGKVILDQHGLSVKTDAGKTNHITEFNSTSAKNDAGYASRWGDTNNLSAFIGVDNQNNPLIYTKGYLYAQEGSNIAGWITDNSGFYHLNGSNQKDLWLSPTGITGTVNDSGSQSFAIYSNGNFGVTTGGDLYSKSGKIAGWTINPTELYSNNVHLRSSSGPTTRAIEVNNGTFYVQNNGKLYAQDADIKGAIKADSGYFNNATIDNCTMTNCSISAAQITSGTFGDTRIANGAITTDKIATGAVNADKIAANSITADKIAANSITADKLDVNTLKTVTAEFQELKSETYDDGGSTFLRGVYMENGQVRVTGWGGLSASFSGDNGLILDTDLKINHTIHVSGDPVTCPTGSFRVQTTSQHALYLNVKNGIIISITKAADKQYTDISNNYDQG